MDVRPYCEADLQSVAAVFTAAVHSLTASHYTSEQRVAWAPQPPDTGYWRKRLQPLHTLVAGEGIEVAGFVSYLDSGSIELLYTSPAFTGRGVASLLYAQAESTLRSNGARELSTQASLVAQPFFQERGFTIVEEQAVTVRGVALRRCSMKKRLVDAQQRVPADVAASRRRG